MKKILIKPLVLLAVFLVSLVTFSVLTNRENTDLTTVMAEASLPVMYFYNGETQINELHGYVKEMDAVGMRDSITPVNSDRMLHMGISTYGKDIRTISYEIRSLDSKRLVAEAVLDKCVKKDNIITADIKVQNILEKNDEYLLIFKINTDDDKSIYYYTRIMQTDECSVEECLKFAQDFHKASFGKKNDSFFATYMEATTGDTTSLSHVDLTSSRSQITWKDFKPEKVSKPTVSFKEINESYNVITLSYLVTHTNENGEAELYNVEEYYRLRMSDQRMYVLNFERDMSQIFNGENNFVNENSEILLGIRSGNIEYKTSGKIISFVQEGELWTFNQGTNEVAQIFSFRDVEGKDIRNNWNQHEIKIVRINEAGSVDFIVYGYMNRGDHEGEVGTAVYHYDGLAHTVEEEAFIPSNKSYEVLKAGMGQLMYENDQKIFYIMIDGNLCSIDLTTLDIKVLIDDLKAGSYATSQSNQYFAWVDSGNQNNSSVLKIMNLQNGNIQKISEGSKKYLKPLGFIDEDFIYGIANAKDVTLDAAGNTTFAMKSLKIMDTSENKDTILKEYSPSRGYIESISVEGYTVDVKLIKKSGKQYLEAGTDSIMNKEADSEDSVAISSFSTDDKLLQYKIKVNGAINAKKTILITSKGVILSDNRTVDISDEVGGDRFYVYVRGKVLLDTDSISDAINMANQKMGVVIDSKQQYVWMRARKIYANAFTGIKPALGDKSGDSVVKCISALLAYKELDINVSEIVQTGTTPKEILINSLKDQMVLDLTGCTAEDIIFYVSKGSPVFAMTGGNSAVLVTGYSSTNIYYYDSTLEKNRSVTYEDANKMFAEGGNKFFTYLDK